MYPAASEGLGGVTAIDTSTAAVTVTVVDPVMLLSVAVIFDVPVVTPVAIPPVEIGATFGEIELQVAVAVRFCVLPSV